MLTLSVSVVDPPLLALRGTIAGADLYHFGEALEMVCQDPTLTVHTDLSEVEEWSLVAQAMVLATAHRLERGGGELILYSPSASLRATSHPLGVFERISTRSGQPARSELAEQL